MLKVRSLSLVIISNISIYKYNSNILCKDDEWLISSRKTNDRLMKNLDKNIKSTKKLMNGLTIYNEKYQEKRDNKDRRVLDKLTSIYCDEKYTRRKENNKLMVKIKDVIKYYDYEDEFRDWLLNRKGCFVYSFDDDIWRHNKKNNELIDLFVLQIDNDIWKYNKTNNVLIDLYNLLIGKFIKKEADINELLVMLHVNVHDLLELLEETQKHINSLKREEKKFDECVGWCNWTLSEVNNYTNRKKQILLKELYEKIK